MRGGARWARVAGGCLAALALAEGVARFVFGLGSPVLYEVVEGYGYRPVAGQRARGPAGEVLYNRLGLRGREVGELPEPGVVRVLCLGDSVTNGGMAIPDGETYPARLEALLREGGGRYEVLNAGCPGWAPPNVLGFVRDRGVFGSSVAVVLVGVDDMAQGAVTGELVGAHPRFPSRRPVWALEEVFRRKAAWEEGGGARGAKVEPSWGQRFRGNVSALRDLVLELRRRGAVPVVCFFESPADWTGDPEVLELVRRRLEGWTAGVGEELVDLGAGLREGGGAALFRDGLHPNAAGNAVLAALIAPHVRAAVGDGAASR